MKWMTLYEIRAASFPFMLLILFFLSVFFFNGIRGYKKEDTKTSIMFVGCLVGFLVVVIALLSQVITFFFGEYDIYGNAYKTNNYACIEGTPTEVRWANGGFDFKVDGLEFFCDFDHVAEREKVLRPHFETGSFIRVFYYAEEMFDESNNQYMVLRIDVLTDGELSE